MGAETLPVLENAGNKKVAIPTSCKGVSTAELARYCFPPEFSMTSSSPVGLPQAEKSVKEEKYMVENPTPCVKDNPPLALQHLEDRCNELRPKITEMLISRSGRETQRWHLDAEECDDGRRTRLVTGALPILQGNRVMLISSRRKPSWILPKGGWEADEAMEESALREAFEEAGVWGLLGQPFCPVVYEAGKKNEYSHVRLAIFPLFVKDVHDDWPESFRARKVVTIEEARRDLAARPEFLAALDFYEMRCDF